MARVGRGRGSVLARRHGAMRLGLRGRRGRFRVVVRVHQPSSPDELLSSKNNTLELPRPIARLHFPRAHSAPLWRCGAMLSDQQKVRNIREYVLGQRRRKAAGKRLPEHHHWERLQCVGCKIWNDEKLACLEPPTCCHCCKLYRNVDSVRPANKAARLARKRLAEKFRRRGVDGNGKRAAPRMTRARAAARAAGRMPVIGVVALFCAASMLGSQLFGPLFRHLFGLEKEKKYGPAFSMNNGGAPMLSLDVFLELTAEKFIGLLERYTEDDVTHHLILITLDCSKASRANRKVKKEEKEAYYAAAVAKVRELVSAAEERYGKEKILLFWAV